MPRKRYNPEERFQLDEGRASVNPQRPRPRQKTRSSRMKSQPSPLSPTMTHGPQSMDSLVRTGLLMAALRVWELKHGIHDYF